MNISREIQRMNKRLGDALGMNPHGEPAYKWIWVNTWMHFMQDQNGYEPKATETGLIVMAPKYIPRRMVPGLDDPNSPHRDRWHVGHWHDSGDEYAWRQMFGSAALWSRFGHYSMTDIWSQQGQAPNQQTTDDLIVRVKQFRAMTVADARKKFAEEATKQEYDKDNLRLDIIGDAMTAFGNDPGKRSGSVSFPSTSAQLNGA